jgi:catechol 2,3-dioxygenase-like lactoylglutathione lyase family enzyme
VGELSDHGVAHEALAAAAATPLAGFEDPAREHGTAGFEALAGHLKSELAGTAERGQIGAREPSSGARRDGSAGHAGVFRMSVQEPSSPADPGPYPVTGAPGTLTGTTLDCEGPGNGPGNPRTSLRPATFPGVDTPVGQLMNIVVDCPDADISARFWAAVLGWERVQENAGWVDIADASDGRRRLVFQQIADYRPPGWPDQGPPQQLHLDVRVDDLEIADQRVRALGAVPLGERVVLEDETYRVYADPAGHPFCLVQPETT